MEYVIGVAVLNRPDDAVARTVGRNSWRSPRIVECSCTFRLRQGRKSGFRELELQQIVSYRPVIDVAVEISRRGPLAAPEHSVDFLIDSIVVVGIELPHVGAIHDVDVLILACPDGKVTRFSFSVFHGWQYEGASGTQILVGIR